MTKNRKMEVICGPMFAGKSSRLIQLAKDYLKQGFYVYAIKPNIDKRYDVNDIVAHTGEKLSDLGVPVASIDIACSDLSNIHFKHDYGSGRIDVLLIDEAQFFTRAIETLDIFGMMCHEVVVYAGLDLDAFGKPFGRMPELLCRADAVTKLTGTCVVCQEPATRTFPKDLGQDPKAVAVGGAERYEGRCCTHWHEGLQPWFMDQWI